MIELNLLPENMRVAKKKPSVKFNMPQIPKLPIVIAAASIILLIHIIIGISAFTMNFRLKRLNSSLMKISPQEQAALSLKKDLDGLNRKLVVIDLLSSKSLVWSSKLFYLNQAVTEGIWLTSLYLDEQQSKSNRSAVSAAAGKGGSKPAAKQVLILKGSAFSHTPAGETAIIGKFIGSIEKNKGFFSDFEGIELASTQRNMLGDKEVMDFTVECYFKSGRSYFEKLQAGTE
ncbi:MAG: hypothetical protein ABH843_06180 [Candidatus Omnitrophota bacterium]